MVVLPKGAEPVSGPFEVTIPRADQPTQVLCAGLAPGPWRITAPGVPGRDAVVEPGKNILIFESPGARYRIEPKAPGPK
jgi:heparin/heparan-sulfate lyase